MPNNVSDIFKKIPSVNELLESPQLKGLVNKVSHNVVVSEVRTFLDTMRTELKHATDEMDIHVPTPSELADRIAKWITDGERPKLRPVINATGIILHTGLGRSPLAEQAVSEMAAIATGYSSVEVDIQTGERSQRIRSVEKLLVELTGAEAAVVVNNNAGATLLTLAALASGQEVIVSRGELIEIGGSYRLPDVMGASGAVLREVGTTNKTRRSDYENACGEETAAIMRAHTSNYRIVGFTEATPLLELIAVARDNNVVMIDDIGSGALVELSKYGLDEEPLVRDSIRAGADVVLFSGDKLLGGPQCGIVVGRKKLIQEILKHPLMRALRVDKTTLAALAATLRLYRDPEEAEKQIPVLQLLSTSVENLQNRAERIAPQIADTEYVASAVAMESTSHIGGGSVPAHEIPTWCVSIEPNGVTLDRLAQSLRTGAQSIFARVQKDRLILDLRTVAADQDLQLVSAFQSLGKGSSSDESSGQ